MTIQDIEAACKNSTPVPLVDVVHARMEFPFSRTFYPLGFPAEISTNDETVLEIAAESWGEFRQVFQTPPIRVQIGVREGHSAECPPVPTCLVQQHLFSFVADQENFGIIDMAQSFSGLWLTAQTVKHRSYLRHFFLECATICPIATRYVTGVHAGCVERNGVGVLLCGDSGAGKSTLSYACAKAGWTYITDDGSFMVNGTDDVVVTGNCHQVRFRPHTASIFPEIHGREITQRAEKGKPSIELSPASLPDIRYSQTAKIKYVVFLNRRDGGNFSLQPYSKDVVRKFLHQGRFSPMDRMPTHYAAIEKLLELEVLELRYDDLDWALQQLELLVETEDR